MSLRIKLAIIGAISAIAVAGIGIIPALINSKAWQGHSGNAKSQVLRITRVKVVPPFDEIAFVVQTDDVAQRFPATYEFATYEPNMSAGEFYFQQQRDHHTVDIEMRARKGRGGVIDFRMRQPLQLSMFNVPIQGSATLRHVIAAGSQSPMYEVTLDYSVEEK